MNNLNYVDSTGAGNIGGRAFEREAARRPPFLGFVTVPELCQNPTSSCHSG